MEKCCLALAVGLLLVNKLDSTTTHSCAYPSRLPPTDFLKEEFFQNKLGLWIYYQEWKSTTTPKGIIILLHGYGEGLHRYNHIAKAFFDYHVFALDHQGFGRSEGDRAHVDMFEDYINDVQMLVEDIISPKYPDLPQYVMGQSMGGLIAIHSSLRLKFQGCILCCPAIEILASSALVRAVGLVIDFVFPKAPLISFPALPSTSLLAAKEHAGFDPLNYNGKIKVHQGLELLKATKFAIEKADTFETPLFIIHGKNDLHASIKGSQLFIEKAASKDKCLLAVETQHEPLQEIRPIRNNIISHIRDWLEIRHCNISSQVHPRGAGR